ncbi:MAG: hypothetical protein ACKVQA_06945 [Burkholderiales bacterium]
MDYKTTLANMGITLTPSQSWAMAWLTMRGQRFLVDFGYTNCEQKADDDVRHFYKM